MAAWTSHTLKRAAEYSIGTKELLDSWNRSVEQELSEEQKAYKFKKYGMESLKDKYFWDQESGLLFTAIMKGPTKKSALVLTVTKGRGNLLGKYMG